MEYRAPGYRFYPTEEELVSFYLQKKLLGDGNRQDLDSVIPVLNIYEFSPWDLPKYAGEICRADSEQWFFFIPRKDKEVGGGKPNRLTSSGYWKATGSPGFVYSSNNRVIGSKRTMVFYKGRAPKGTKTEWKMTEYRAAAAAINIAAAGDQVPNSSSPASTSNSATPKFRQELTLSRVYKKSKFLRSFDRRPSEEKIREGRTVLDPHGPNHEAETTSSASAHQNQNTSSPLMVEKKSSSPADDNTTTSSGGDHCNENINNLCSDLPMWEWEWEWEWEWDQPFN